MTRERILVAGEATFLEKGFHGASVDSIAAEAGYTTGAIYSNFRDKDGLFLAVSDRRFERLYIQQESQFRDARTVEDVAAVLGGILTEQDKTMRPWGVVALEFYAYAVRNPRAYPRLQTMMRETTEWMERAYGPFAEKCGIPAPKLARIMLALLNGMFIIRLADDTVDETELTAFVLSRLVSGATPAEAIMDITP